MGVWGFGRPLRVEDFGQVEASCVKHGDARGARRPGLGLCEFRVYRAYRVYRVYRAYRAYRVF